MTLAEYLALSLFAPGELSDAAQRRLYASLEAANDDLLATAGLARIPF